MTKRGAWGRWAVAGALLVTLAGGVSCAYYNTFYLARKYYFKATDGLPYEVDREGTTQRANYTKSAEYSKKVLGVYPKSKWVDDAYLMWARTFLGVDDPLKAVAMLEEFQARYPQSEVRPDAEFFLGLAYRLGRKHEQAIAAFDEFLVQAPKHELVPYAWYERSKSLLSLQRYREAAESAGRVVDGYPKHRLHPRALRQRAEARFQQGDYAAAQADFNTMGTRALTDEERLRFTLREVDCLEAARRYDDARELLKDTRASIAPPPPLPTLPRAGTTTTTTTPQGGLPQSQVPATAFIRTPEQERFGRVTLRMGGVEVMAGNIEKGVEYYRDVIEDYPRSQLAAEAQYRIGYAYETGGDDFARARSEYAKVREQVGTSQFAQQADQRLENLDRIERYRTNGDADSVTRAAESRFLRAEHYLFVLQRPERALEEYRSILDSVTVPAVRAHALNAQAWLLARKLERGAEAESLWWRVVREFPETEGQLAARDFLEARGQSVPASLIVPPKPKPKAKATADSALTQPPAGTGRLGTPGGSPGIAEPAAVRYGPGARPSQTPAQFRSAVLTDSLRRALAARDSVVRAARDTTATRAVRDTTAGRSRVDSLRRLIARPDSARARGLVPPVTGVVLAPDTVAAPDFTKVDSLPPNAFERRDGATVLPQAPPMPVAPVRDTARTDSTRAKAVADSARTDTTAVRSGKSAKGAKGTKAKPPAKPTPPPAPKPATSDTSRSPR